MARRRQLVATRSAAAQQATPPPEPPRPRSTGAVVLCPRRSILRTRLESLTPIEAAVLRTLMRCGRATPRDIVRNVRGVEDAHAILN